MINEFLKKHEIKIDVIEVAYIIALLSVIIECVLLAMGYNVF